MLKGQDFLKAKLNQVSAKTLSLGGKQFVRSRNEQKIKFQEEFTYTPLSGPRYIRLVKLQDGSDTDVVSCDIYEASLDENPAFEALSYTWDLGAQWSATKFDFVDDEKKEERPILCNGKTQHVTMNLYHALTELRRQKLEIPIWADQICIHQENNNEKAAQLAIMSDIYRSATQVTVWLGKLNMLRSQALDFMERMPGEPSQHTRTSSNLGSEEEISALSRSMKTMSSFSNSIGEHYHRLTSILVIGNRWFIRAWTLQEFLLATQFRLIMGNREIAPSSIINAVLQMVEFYNTDQLSQRAGLSVEFNSAMRKYLLPRAKLFDERERFRNGKRYSAEEYLRAIRIRRCSKMKDKGFAGAALMEADVSSNVDYHSTTLEIYTAFALDRLWPEVSVFMLSLVGGTEPGVEGLPSWMPDLNKQLRPQPLQYCGCPHFEAPLYASRREFNVDEKALQAHALQWDVVEAVGESNWSWGRFDWDPYNSKDETKMRSSDSAPNERYGMMFALLDKLGVDYAPTGERTVDAFWQTLIGGVNLKSEEDITVWRDRFQQWFAFNLVSIRSTLLDEKKKAGKLLSSTDKWKVPLIADYSMLEQRVAAFLDTHDTHVKDAEVDVTGLRLRKTISYIMKRLLGVEQIEALGAWSGSLGEMLSIVRREDFYDPVSVFEEQFSTVYDGRRIFVSKRGYLGVAPEGITAGDLIFLIAGAEVPYVLRPLANKDRTYTLVGEAYVHGIVNRGDQLAEDSKLVSINII